MSGAVKAVKKVFKKVVRVVKKYWKVIAIAVAAYFTFGMALGAMPAAGAATGSVAAGTGAAATGTGVMTATAATATGTAATAAGTIGAIETVTVTAAATGGGISTAGAIGAAAAGGAAAAAGAGGGGGAPAPTPAQPPPKVIEQPAAKPSMVQRAKGAWKDMSFSDKLLLAKAGVDVATAVTAPSPEEEAAAAAKWQGAFYGMTADEAAKAQGKTQFVTQQATPQRPPATAGGKVGQRDIVGSGGAGPPVMGSEQQPGQALPPTQMMQFQATAQQPAAAPAAPPEQVTNMGGNRDLFAQRAPGVRYLV